MTLFQFRPVAGRPNGILDILMHSRGVTSYPFLPYVFCLVSEEITVNIISYAYPQEMGGHLTLCLQGEGGEIVLKSIDGGAPFDPLAKADPDTSLPLEQCEIGGSRIFLVRKMVDDVAYIYVNKEN